MTDMKFTRRIGADVLDLNRAITLIRQLTVILSGVENRFEVIVNNRRLKIEIHETRARDLNPIKQITVDAPDYNFSDLFGARAEDFRRFHCKIGGEIAELLFGRHFEFNRRQGLIA